MHIEITERSNQPAAYRRRLRGSKLPNGSAEST